MIVTLYNLQHAASSAKHRGQGVALATALSLAASLAQAATPALPDPLAALPGEASLKPAQLAAKPASVPAPAAKAAVVSHTAAVQPAPVMLATVRQSPASAPTASFPTPLLRPVQPQSAAPIVPPAQRVAPTSNVVTLRQLDELRSQIALATEQVQLAELRAKLPAAATAAQPHPIATQNAHNAQVVSVYGLNDQLTAVVQLSTGGIVKAHVGMTLPGIGTIQSIAHNEVKVSTASGVLSLNIAPIAPEAR